METQTIILIAAVVIVDFLVLRFITKNFLKIIGLVVVLGAGAYFLFYHNGGLIGNASDEFLMDRLEEKYCMEKADTAICDCVMPVLLQDLKTYSPEEILEMKDDQLKAIQFVVKSVGKNRKEINDCLAQYDSEITVDRFISDIKKMNLGAKVKEFLDSVGEE